MEKISLEVPFFDLKIGNLRFKNEIQGLIDKQIEEGQFIGGPALENFENRFSKYLNIGHCIGVANGNGDLVRLQDTCIMVVLLVRCDLTSLDYAGLSSSRLFTRRFQSQVGFQTLPGLDLQL